MMKYFLLITATLLLFAFSYFPDEGVTLKHNYPVSVNAGEEITTEIIISKTISIQFGKLQIDVPPGISVTVNDAKGGQFTSSENNGKIIWMQFPNENEVKIQVKLKISPDASGTQTINTKFQYVTGNEKKSVEIPSHEIVISGPSKEQISQANKEKDSTENFNTPEEPDSRVTVQRSVSKDEKTGLFTVSIRINKENIKGFAKYTDAIPPGLVATKGSATASGAFKFSENKASIVWATLPKDEIIEATYYIKPTQSFSENPTVKGNFAYLEDETTKKVDAADIVLYLINKEEETKVAADSVPINKKEEAETIVQTESTEKEKAKDNSDNKQDVLTEKEQESKITASENKQDKPLSSGSAGIVFHVQIGAYKNTPGISYFEKKYKLGEEIFSDMHNGLNKYMVGKFEEYKSARDHREVIRGKGVKDAFVTAYGSGKRITVQEALMTLNQKWFR